MRLINRCAVDGFVGFEPVNLAGLDDLLLDGLCDDRPTSEYRLDPSRLR
jgi:hypothetical protein